MSTSWEQLIDNFLKERWEQSPVLATAEGIHNYDHQLDSLNPEAIEERLQTVRRQILALEKARPVDPDEQIDREAVLGECRSEQLELERIQPWRSDPSVAINIGLQAIYLLRVRSFAPMEERAESILSRLEQFPRLLQEGQAALDRPVPVFLKVAEEVLQGAKHFLDDTAEELGRQLPHLQKIFRTTTDRVVSVLNQYDHFLKAGVQPASKDRFAIGVEAFQGLLQHRHHLSLTPEELVQIGEETAKGVEGELARLAKAIEPRSTWKKIIAKFKQEHPSSKELVEVYRKEMERARDFCRDRNLISFPKVESLQIVPTPEFERPTSPYAALMSPAPFEKDQTSYFYVTPVEDSMSPEEQEERLQGHSFTGLPVTALHEAYPGHHLQLTVANQLPSRVRRVIGTSVLWEGWALYCEEMMYEEGFYADPRVRLYQLKDLLWRACRVMIDVGLHTQGWSVERAVQLLVDRAALEPANARCEVWRYCGTPTQPMSYLIGRREILALREEVRKKEGKDFSLKRFHDRLLSFGSFSPALTRKYWNKLC
ncbi:MAG: DUF885 domain-containing protein [Deltaproteobacteria bacterium]|nr:DUF885 domain-containing protein [Deltaproteobacteria bacterium]